MRKKLLAVLLTLGGCCLFFPGTLSVRGDEVVDSIQQTKREGWVKENGKVYFYRNGKKVKGIVKIKKKYYFFHPKTGVRKRGLIRYKGKKYYFSKKWYAVKGFQKVKGELVYCNSKGLICNPSGLVAYQGKRYFYDGETGEQITGWVHKGEYSYYFSKRKGYALTGWQTIKGKEYYFNSKGILLTNRWIQDLYYVNDKGVRVTGWLRLGEEVYYLNPENGEMSVGFTDVGSETYYFDQDGLMLQNQWIEDCWLDEDGVMAKETWVGAYYVGEDGKKTGEERSAGFFKENGQTYYLDSLFQRKTGWVYHNGEYYYFDETTGVLKKNLWVGPYYVNANGKRTTGTLKNIDGNTYYFQEDGLCATGLLYLGEDGYYFDQNGIMQTGLVTLNGSSYYFAPDDGKMAVNEELAMNGKRFLFDEDGVLIKETPIAANSEKGEAIADYASQFVGNPYKSGGTSLTEGADSSGFTQSVLAHFNIKIPRISSSQATGESPYGGSYTKPQIISVEELQPGDLIFYGSPINHAAIYLGNRKIIHAFNSKQGIVISRYDYKTITACARYW